MDALSLQLLAEQPGASKNGPWRKQEFILESAGKFPKSRCIVVWGDNIDQVAIQVDEQITAAFDTAAGNTMAAGRPT